MESMRTVLRPIAVVAIVGLIVALVALSGCSGGADDTCGYGAAKGWVFTDGTSCIVSGSSSPPPGYFPAAGAKVQIVGFPALETVTDANGQYFLDQIPPGLQILRVGAPCGNLEYQILIIAGQVTIGGGHSEGGS